MASQFKNRLVGVTILVASVVIFLPSIIDGKKTIYEDEFVATPIKPDTKEHTQVLSDVIEVAPVEDESVINIDMSGNKEANNTDWQIEEVADVVTIESSDPQTSQKQVEKIKVVDNKSVHKTAVNKPLINKKMPDTAWTIQLGAFQNSKNINQLLKKLHKAGFQAHTIPSEVIDGRLTRVFVGPDVSKSKLEKQLPQLKRLTKLQGKLLPFNAVNP